MVLMVFFPLILLNHLDAWGLPKYDFKGIFPFDFI